MRLNAHPRQACERAPWRLCRKHLAACRMGELPKMIQQNPRALFERLLRDEKLPTHPYTEPDVRMMGAVPIPQVAGGGDTGQSENSEMPPKAGIVALGLPEYSFSESNRIGRSQCQSFCSMIGQMLTQQVRERPEFGELLDSDFLLYYISMSNPASPLATIEALATADNELSHAELIDQVLELGQGLGFEVEKEFEITHGCRVDALWSSHIANLGTIRYAFEIHRKGSRDSAILNLQRARREPSIQRVIIVSFKRELRRFHQEIWTLGEEFRNAVGYLTVQQLQTAVSHLRSLKNTLRTLGLLSGQRFSI